MNIYIAIAIFIVLIVSIVSLCISMNSASKINSMINYADDGNLIEDIKKYYKRFHDIVETM